MGAIIPLVSAASHSTPRTHTHQFPQFLSFESDSSILYLEVYTAKRGIRNEFVIGTLRIKFGKLWRMQLDAQC